MGVSSRLNSLAMIVDKMVEKEDMAEDIPKFIKYQKVRTEKIEEIIYKNIMAVN